MSGCVFLFPCYECQTARFANLAVLKGDGNGSILRVVDHPLVGRADAPAMRVEETACATIEE
jgi:hypothetical protein